MSCVSAGLFDGLFGGDDNKSITLTNTTTDGWCNSYDDGTSSSVYEIEGILNNLPDNVNKYELKVSIYDENGKLIKEDNGYNLKSIVRSSEKSKPSLIGMVIIDDSKNVSNIEVKLIDEEGTIVFNENTTFDMDNMDINHLTKETSSSSDDDEYEHSDWYKKYQDSLDKRREKEIREGTYYPDFD